MIRRVLVLTGTRADFGKQKTLMRALQDHAGFDLEVFVTGMHLLRRYGTTVEEISKAGIRGLHTYANQVPGEPMDLVLANTVAGLGRHVHDRPPDLIVVHGDRVEALSGAIVGSLRNIRTVHIEGGEVSGTIDGSIRHAISKLSHVHFVANDLARRRLVQLGESPASVFAVGSPEVDVMLSDDLPPLTEVRGHYGLPRGAFGIVAFHPVTTELGSIREQASALVDALLGDEGTFIVIEPNNDEGTNEIALEFDRLRDIARFKHYPSMRFESYLTLLKHADVIVGNSSSAVREAPVFGTPSVCIGTRQQGRARSRSIIECTGEAAAITKALSVAREAGRFDPELSFGAGGATAAIIEVLEDERFWTLPTDKVFHDL